MNKALNLLEENVGQSLRSSAKDVFLSQRNQGQYIKAKMGTFSYIKTTIKSLAHQRSQC